jgi:hypothetical protein
MLKGVDHSLNVLPTTSAGIVMTRTESIVCSLPLKNIYSSFEVILYESALSFFVDHFVIDILA